MEENITALEGLAFESVTVKAQDGVTLCGRLYKGKEGAPLEILFHGYRAHALRDFCCGGRYAFGKGHSVLLVDQRGQGESGGRTITFGAKEKYDCLFWCRYAAQRFENTPIFLSGVSMGAATVLLSSALPLPKAVKGIIADSPYESAEGIIKKVIREDLRLPSAPLYFIIRLFGKLFGGFDLKDADLLALPQENIPILLIHGEDDRFVPCDMSRNLQSTHPAWRCETFPKAGHGISYMHDTPRYEKLLTEFMEENL